MATMKEALFNETPPLIQGTSPERLTAERRNVSCRSFDADPLGCMMRWQFSRSFDADPSGVLRCRWQSNSSGRGGCAKGQIAPIRGPMSYGCDEEVGASERNASLLAPRVAVCLTGAPRTFTLPHVHRSLLRHLLWQRNEQGAQVATRKQDVSRPTSRFAKVCQTPHLTLVRCVSTRSTSLLC
jgi:hypothetical protein